MSSSRGRSSTSAIALHHNLYFSQAGVESGEFSLNGTFYTGLLAWQTGTGQDGSSLSTDPLLVGPPNDFHLESGSPAIDAGDPAYVSDANETDLDGDPRREGQRVDIGVDEAGGRIFADGFELGDTSAWSNP